METEQNRTGYEKKPNRVRENRTPNRPPMISIGTSKNKILGMLKKGLNLTRMAKTLNLQKSTVSQHLKELERKNYIYKDGYFWKLTNIGIRYIEDEFGSLAMYETSSEVTTSWIQDRAHNIKVKVEVVRKPDNHPLFYDWKQTSKGMNNQNFYINRFDNLSVIYTGKSILIQLPIIRANDSELAMSEATRLTNLLLTKIEKSMKGLKLGSFEIMPQIYKQHHAIPQEPISKVAKQLNLSYRDDKIDVDASDTPELEFIDPKTAQKDFMRYLEHVKDFSTKNVLKPSEMQKAIQDTQEQLNNLTKLTQITNMQLQIFIKTTTPNQTEIKPNYEELRKWV